MSFKPEQIYNFWSKFLRDAGCYHLLYKEAEVIVNGIFEDFPKLQRLFTDEAKNCMCKNYLARMERLYLNPLITEFQKALTNYDPDEAVALEGKNLEAVKLAGKDVKANTKNYSPNYFRDKYSPIFCEYENNIRKNFIDSMKEFLMRFSESADKISSELLDGKIIAKVIGLSSDSADVHRHGRMVMRVQTDAGNFFYKPHDCGLDTFYHDLISKYFSECTCAAKVVEGEGYAFISELEYKDLNSPKDVGKFYYNFGMLTAIFHGLGATDMHQENIIACGVRPSAADIETIVSARIKLNSTNIYSQHRIDKDFMYSVLRTLVFPAKMHKLPLLSSLHLMNEKHQNAPKFNGQRFNIEGHEEEFIAGFKEGYKRLLKHRDEIKHMFKTSKHICVRYVLRNTTYYAFMLSYLFMADAMTSREAQAEVLKKLNSPFDTFNEKIGREGCIPYERACLIQGDIPYYCLGSSGHALCGEDVNHIIEEDFFAINPEELLEKKLDILSEKEYTFEEDLIKYVLTHVPYDIDYNYEEIRIPLRTAKIEELRETAVKIYNEVASYRIRMTNGLFAWQSISSSVNSAKSIRIYNTYADLGRFCAKLSRNTYPAASETLEKCLEGINAQITQWEREKERLTRTGLFAGLGGLFSGLGDIAEEKFEQAKELITRLLKIVNSDLDLNEEETSIAYGVSGLILALYSLKRKGYSDVLIDELINKSSVFLCEHDLPKNSTGARGLDGTGAAFAALYACTGDEKFAAQADNIFLKVREGYAEHLGGWPENDTVLQWFAKKSAWSAGVLCNALTASEILKGSEIVHEVLKLALGSILNQDNLFERDSIFDGNALYVLALLKAHRYEQKTLYLDKAGQILEAMLERYRKYKVFNIMPQGVNSFFDPSFSFGSTGIGYVMLDYISERENGRK